MASSSNTLVGVIAILGILGLNTTEAFEENAVKFKNPPTYLILAPSLIRPNEDLQISVSLYDIDHYELTVRASLRMGGHEYAYAKDIFHPYDSRLLQMKIPRFLPSGNYSLRVEGRVGETAAGLIFYNESRVAFDSKQVSIFIETHKPIMKKGLNVHFRVLAVRRDLKPADGRVNIYVYETGGALVRRWINQQLSFGMVSKTFKTGKPVQYGYFTIVVDGFGHKYDYKFDTLSPHTDRFDVNVSMPTYIMEDDFGLAGTIMANHTGDSGVVGNGTVSLKIYPKDSDKTGEITKSIPHINGVTSFLFTMDEMKAVLDDLGDAILEVTARIFSWNLLEEQSSKAKTKVYRSGVRLKFLGESLRTFKPNVKADVYLAVEGYDGSRFAGSRRQIAFRRTVKSKTGTNVQGIEEYYVIPDDSIVRYSFIPQSHDEVVTVRATYDHSDEERLYIECHFMRHYSPSQTYIHISTSTRKPKVNEFMVFTVRTSTRLEHVKYLLVSGANIILQNNLWMQHQQKTFSIAMSPHMAPRATIVVTGIRPVHGEIVTDSLSFYVEPSGYGGLTLTTNTGKDFIGDDMEIIAKTDPGSLVVLSSHLLEMYAIGGAPFITKEKVYRDLESYDEHVTGTFRQTWWNSEEKYEDIHIPAPTYGVDSTTTFEFAGLLALTDSGLVRVPNQCNITNGWSICYDGTCFPSRKRCDGEVDCSFGSDEMGCNKDRDKVERPPYMEWLVYKDRFILPSDFAWVEQMTKPDGRADIVVAPPTRAVIFVVGGFAISQQNGLQFLNEPIRLDCLSAFYTKVEGPSFAYAGEQIGFRITLFNFWDQYLEVLVTLHGSEQYQFVHVEDGGYVSSYNPRRSFGEKQVLVYIEVGQTRIIHFPVLPVVKGTVKVTFTAATFIRQETVTKTVKIRHNGVTNEFHTPYLIDLVSSGSRIIPDLWIPVPERFIHPEQTEHLYVPGSQEAIVTIVGDVVGPSFFSSKMSVESLLGRYSDTGEPIGFNVAVNILWMEYLHATSQLTSSRRRNAINVINPGIQALCAYTSPEGAARMFRKGADSVWMTAFYLKTLHKATLTQWPMEMYVDVGILNQMALWLVKQQNITTGAFPRTASLFDRKMMSNKTTIGGEEVDLNLSLNAYVLITLSSMSKLSGVVRSKVTDAKGRTANYLAQHMDQITDPFQQAIITYALHVADHSSRSVAFEKLKSMQIIPGGYWASKPIPEIKTRIFNTVPFLMARDPYENEANAVAATSYAMMSYLVNGEFDQCGKMVRWLQTQRDTYGGFFSTQDTVVALEALTMYSIRDTHRKLFNMLIVLESTSTPNWKKEIRITRENFATVHTVKIPKVYGSVKATASGTGRALMQLITKVNVEYPWQLNPAAARSYDIWVEDLLFWGKNSSFMDITLCMRWMRPDLYPTSGLSVIEMEMPTGFVITKQELRRQSKRGPKTLKRSRFSYSSAIIRYWFEYIGTTKSCTSFRAERWYPVANSTIQHKIILYDFYEPDLYNFTMYNTYTLFNHHICHVCGSYQCPYCPDYNTSVMMSSLPQLSLLLPFAIIMHCMYHWKDVSVLG